MSPFASLSFADLVKLLKKLPFDEIRKEYDGYFEFVVSVQHLQQVYPHFEAYYGAPFKPPGMAANAKAQTLTKNYGGIQTQQTLYYAGREDGIADCAMIWPWNDGKHATIKMARGRIGE
jgi:hypothetical protein